MTFVLKKIKKKIQKRITHSDISSFPKGRYCIIPTIGREALGLEHKKFIALSEDMLENFATQGQQVDSQFN